ncbi:MAG: linear amide C-N hydrolase [Anaerolineae bacterium]|nr:linear amide C-N hydrolase [Anaerolineae bacterium]
MKKILHSLWILGLVVILSLLAGCSTSEAAAPTSQAPETIEGLSSEEVETLSSLEKVDDYPLYTMHYYGSYNQRLSGLDSLKAADKLPITTHQAWGCSLFTALGDAENMLYGRNFDWESSPAVLLFTDPPDGYASVSMVDMAYFGITESTAGSLLDLPLLQRRNLLNAPTLPFDGMNERGLAIGMAAVPGSSMPPDDPTKKIVGSIAVIREMLDRAGTVNEALDILRSYNIIMEGGQPIHYLIADTSGQASLVEFYEGEIVVIPNEHPWHLATNFFLASVDKASGECRRYDSLNKQLTEAEGRLASRKALGILDKVSQDSTQWSVVYEMSTGDINVVMGQQYNTAHTFHLDMSDD